VTARTLAIAAVVVFAIGVAAVLRTPFGGWLQSFVYGSGVRWEDAYRGLDAAEPSVVPDIERRRLAWAQAEDEPPAGLKIGPRRHPPGMLARLRYETFDVAGAPLDVWDVRALVPRLPDIAPRRDREHPQLGWMGCPAECRAALERAHGALITQSGEPGIGGEWILRMPVGETFDLGRRSLVTHDIFADASRQLPITFRRVAGRDIPEPAAIRVTLLDVCRPRVRIGAVTRLEFHPFTTVPIPKGFVTTRWVQLDGCA
jgi:hypothetical protein